MQATEQKSVCEKMNYIPFKKFICSITALSFLFSIIGNDIMIEKAWAAKTTSNTPINKLDITNFEVPFRFGEIKEASQGKNGKTIIHVQDAHCDYSAQKAITGIIGHLTNTYNIDLVMLEGGKGDYDLSIFTKIKNPDTRNRVSDYFVREGRVNGAEYFAINNPEKVKLFGIEDEKLYFKNLEAYRNSLSFQEEANKDLNTLSSIIGKFKYRIYPRQLKELDEKAAKYNNKELEFKEYLSFLINKAIEAGLDLKSFGSVNSLSEILKSESSIDFKKADKERAVLIDKLSKGLSKIELEQLIKNSAEFAAGNMPSEEYYGYLFKKARLANTDINNLPDLLKYREYVKKYEAIDKLQLFKEIKSLEEKLFEALATSEDQKALRILDRNFSIIKGMFRVSLIKEEYDHYLANKDSFNIKNYLDFFAKRSQLFSIKFNIDDNIARLDSYRAEMEKFYDYSLKRDDAFIKNTESKLKKEKKNIAILVSGGFHSGNLSKLFTQKGYTYIEVTPKITKSSPDNPYFKLLAGENTEFDKFLMKALSPTPQTSNIAVPSLFSQLGITATHIDDTLKMRDLEVKVRAAVEEKGRCIIGTKWGYVLISRVKLDSEHNVTDYDGVMEEHDAGKIYAAAFNKTPQEHHENVDVESDITFTSLPGMEMRQVREDRPAFRSSTNGAYAVDALQDIFQERMDPRIPKESKKAIARNIHVFKNTYSISTERVNSFIDAKLALYKPTFKESLGRAWYVTAGIALYSAVYIIVNPSLIGIFFGAVILSASLAVNYALYAFTSYGSKAQIWQDNFKTWFTTMVGYNQEFKTELVLYFLDEVANYPGAVPEPRPFTNSVDERQLRSHLASFIPDRDIDLKTKEAIADIVLSFGERYDIPASRLEMFMKNELQVYLHDYGWATAKTRGERAARLEVEFKKILIRYFLHDLMLSGLLPFNSQDAAVLVAKERNAERTSTAGISRRDFLKVAAITGAGLLISPDVVLGGSKAAAPEKVFIYPGARYDTTSPTLHRHFVLYHNSLQFAIESDGRLYIFDRATGIITYQDTAKGGRGVSTIYPDDRRHRTDVDLMNSMFRAAYNPANQNAKNIAETRDLFAMESSQFVATIYNTSSSKMMRNWAISQSKQLYTVRTGTSYYTYNRLSGIVTRDDLSIPGGPVSIYPDEDNHKDFIGLLQNIFKDAYRSDEKNAGHVAAMRDAFIKESSNSIAEFYTTSSSAMMRNFTISRSNNFYTGRTGTSFSVFNRKTGEILNDDLSIPGGPMSIMPSEPRYKGFAEVMQQVFNFSYSSNDPDAGQVAGLRDSFRKEWEAFVKGTPNRRTSTAGVPEAQDTRHKTQEANAGTDVMATIAQKAPIIGKILTFFGIMLIPVAPVVLSGCGNKQQSAITTQAIEKPSFPIETIEVKYVDKGTAEKKHIEIVRGTNSYEVSDGTNSHKFYFDTRKIDGETLKSNHDNYLWKANAIGELLCDAANHAATAQDVGKIKGIIIDFAKRANAPIPTEIVEVVYFDKTEKEKKRITITTGSNYYKASSITYTGSSDNVYQGDYTFYWDSNKIESGDSTRWVDEDQESAEKMWYVIREAADNAATPQDTEKIKIILQNFVAKVKVPLPVEIIKVPYTTITVVLGTNYYEVSETAPDAYQYRFYKDTREIRAASQRVGLEDYQKKAKAMGEALRSARDITEKAVSKDAKKVAGIYADFKTNAATPLIEKITVNYGNSWTGTRTITITRSPWYCSVSSDRGGESEFYFDTGEIHESDSNGESSGTRSNENYAKLKKNLVNTLGTARDNTSSLFDKEKIKELLDAIEKKAKAPAPVKVTLLPKQWWKNMNRTSTAGMGSDIVEETLSAYRSAADALRLNENKQEFAAIVQEMLDRIGTKSLELDIRLPDKIRSLVFNMYGAAIPQSLDDLSWFTKGAQRVASNGGDLKQELISLAGELRQRLLNLANQKGADGVTPAIAGYLEEISVVKDMAGKNPIPPTADVKAPAEAEQQVEVPAYPVIRDTEMWKWSLGVCMAVLGVFGLLIVSMFTFDLTQLKYSTTKVAVRLPATASSKELRSKPKAVSVIDKGEALYFYEDSLSIVITLPDRRYILDRSSGVINAGPSTTKMYTTDTKGTQKIMPDEPYYIMHKTDILNMLNRGVRAGEQTLKPDFIANGNLRAMRTHAEEVFARPDTSRSEKRLSTSGIGEKPRNMSKGESDLAYRDMLEELSYEQLIDEARAAIESEGVAEFFKLRSTGRDYDKIRTVIGFISGSDDELLPYNHAMRRIDVLRSVLTWAWNVKHSELSEFVSSDLPGGLREELVDRAVKLWEEGGISLETIKQSAAAYSKEISSKLPPFNRTKALMFGFVVPAGIAAITGISALTGWLPLEVAIITSILPLACPIIYAGAWYFTDYSPAYKAIENNIVSGDFEAFARGETPKTTASTSDDIAILTRYMSTTINPDTQIKIAKHILEIAAGEGMGAKDMVRFVKRQFGSDRPPLLMVFRNIISGGLDDEWDMQFVVKIEDAAKGGAFLVGDLRRYIASIKANERWYQKIFRIKYLAIIAVTAGILAGIMFHHPLQNKSTQPSDYYVNEKDVEGVNITDENTNTRYSIQNRGDFIFLQIIPLAGDAETELANSTRYTLRKSDGIIQTFKPGIAYRPYGGQYDTDAGDIRRIFRDAAKACDTPEVRKGLESIAGEAEKALSKGETTSPKPAAPKDEKPAPSIKGRPGTLASRNNSFRASTSGGERIDLSDEPGAVSGQGADVGKVDMLKGSVALALMQYMDPRLSSRAQRALADSIAEVAMKWELNRKILKSVAETFSAKLVVNRTVSPIQKVFLWIGGVGIPVLGIVGAITAGNVLWLLLVLAPAAAWIAVKTIMGTIFGENKIIEHIKSGPFKAEIAHFIGEKGGEPKATSVNQAGAAGRRFSTNGRDEEIKRRQIYLSSESLRDLAANTSSGKTKTVFVGLECLDKILHSDKLIEGMEADSLTLSGPVKGSIDPDGNKIKSFLEKLPTPVREALAKLAGLISGGPANSSARISVQLSRPKEGGNIEVSFVTAYGPDGEMFVKELESLGIDMTPSIRSDKDTATTLAFEMGDSKRSFLHVMGASADLTIDKLKPGHFAGRKVAEFGGIELTGLMPDIDIALKMAKDAGCITVFDTVADPARQWKQLRQSERMIGRDYIREVLKSVDVFTPSDKEARQIITDYLYPDDVNKAKEAAEKLTPEMMRSFFIEHGAKAVFLKMGKKGVYARTTTDSVFKKAAEFKMPIFKGFRAQSATGTGDAFAAGLAYALTRDWEVEKAAMFGNIIGGMCVQYKGGTIGDESLVDALYYMERLKAQMLAEAILDPNPAVRKAGEVLLSRLEKEGSTKFATLVEKEIAGLLYQRAFPNSPALSPAEIESPDFGLENFKKIGLSLEVAAIYNSPNGGGVGHTGKVLINRPGQLLIEHQHKTIVVLKKGTSIPVGYTDITSVVNDFEGIREYNPDGSVKRMKYEASEYTIALADSEKSNLNKTYKDKYLVEELEGKSETFVAMQGDGVLLTDNAQVLYADGYDPREIPAEWQDKIAKLRNEQGENITTKGAIYMKAGTVVLLPKNTKHAFLAGNEGAVYVEFSSPSIDEADHFTDKGVKRLPKDADLTESKKGIPAGDIMALYPGITPQAEKMAPLLTQHEFNKLLSRAMPMLPPLPDEKIEVKNGWGSSTFVSYSAGVGRGGHEGRVISGMAHQFSAFNTHLTAGTFKCIQGDAILIIDEDANILRKPYSFDPFEITPEVLSKLSEAATRLGYEDVVKRMKQIHIVPGMEVCIPEGARYAFFSGSEGFTALEFTSPVSTITNSAAAGNRMEEVFSIDGKSSNEDIVKEIGKKGAVGIREAVEAVLKNLNGVERGLVRRINLTASIFGSYDTINVIFANTENEEDYVGVKVVKGYSNDTAMRLEYDVTVFSPDSDDNGLEKLTSDYGDLEKNIKEALNYLRKLPEWKKLTAESGTLPAAQDPRFTGRKSTAGKPATEPEKVAMILGQAKSADLREVAVQNLSLFTNPDNFKARMKEFRTRIKENFQSLDKDGKKNTLYTVAYLEYMLSSPVIRSYTLLNPKYNNTLTNNDIDKEVEETARLLRTIESVSRDLGKDVLNEFLTKMETIQLKNIKEPPSDENPGQGLLAEWAKEARKSTALTGSLADFTRLFLCPKVANSKWLKTKLVTGEISGNDYGPGTTMLLPLGVDLVMMNPTLAIRAISENKDIQEQVDEYVREHKDLGKWDLLAGATKIAGIEARVALRGLFHLTHGQRGRVSFQVNARNYNERDKIASDIVRLGNELDEEAAEMDKQLLLEDVLAPEDLDKKSGTGRTHTFFKIDSSSPLVYGKLEEEILKYMEHNGNNLILRHINTGGVIEEVLAEGRDVNGTVAGSVSDGIALFLAQIIGHRKAAQKGFAVHASIITKMAGRVEASLRWIAIQKVMAALKAKGYAELHDQLTNALQTGELDIAKNGALDNKILRRAASLAGVEVSLPSDKALRRAGAAICQRSNDIMNALREKFESQDVTSWETGDLLAATREAEWESSRDVFAHYEYTNGMYSRGWFPRLQYCIESMKDEEFNQFLPKLAEAMKNNPKGMYKRVEDHLISEVLDSDIGEEFRQVYELNQNQAEILTRLGIFKEEWGAQGLKISDFANHPFAQQTLFNKVYNAPAYGFTDNIPQTDAEKDAVEKGFVADCNTLANELEEKAKSFRTSTNGIDVDSNLLEIVERACVMAITNQQNVPENASKSARLAAANAIVILGRLENALQAGEVTRLPETLKELEVAIKRDKIGTWSPEIRLRIPEFGTTFLGGDLVLGLLNKAIAASPSHPMAEREEGIQPLIATLSVTIAKLSGEIASLGSRLSTAIQENRTGDEKAISAELIGKEIELERAQKRLADAVDRLGKHDIAAASRPGDAAYARTSTNGNPAIENDMTKIMDRAFKIAPTPSSYTTVFDAYRSYSSVKEPGDRPFPTLEAFVGDLDRQIEESFWKGLDLSLAFDFYRFMSLARHNAVRVDEETARRYGMGDVQDLREALKRAGYVSMYPDTQLGDFFIYVAEGSEAEKVLKFADASIAIEVAEVFLDDELTVLPFKVAFLDKGANGHRSFLVETKGIDTIGAIYSDKSDRWLVLRRQGEGGIENVLAGDLLNAVKDGIRHIKDSDAYRTALLGAWRNERARLSTNGISAKLAAKLEAANENLRDTVRAILDNPVIAARDLSMEVTGEKKDPVITVVNPSNASDVLIFRLIEKQSSKKDEEGNSLSEFELLVSGRGKSNTVFSVTDEDPAKLVGYVERAVAIATSPRNSLRTDPGQVIVEDNIARQISIVLARAGTVEDLDSVCAAMEKEYGENAAEFLKPWALNAYISLGSLEKLLQRLIERNRAPKVAEAVANAIQANNVKADNVPSSGISPMADRESIQALIRALSASISKLEKEIPLSEGPVREAKENELESAKARLADAERRLGELDRTYAAPVRDDGYNVQRLSTNGVGSEVDELKGLLDSYKNADRVKIFRDGRLEILDAANKILNSKSHPIVGTLFTQAKAPSELRDMVSGSDMTRLLIHKNALTDAYQGRLEPILRDLGYLTGYVKNLFLNNTVPPFVSMDYYGIPVSIAFDFKGPKQAQEGTSPKDRKNRKKIADIYVTIGSKSMHQADYLITLQENSKGDLKPVIISREANKLLEKAKEASSDVFISVAKDINEDQKTRIRITTIEIIDSIRRAMSKDPRITTPRTAKELSDVLMIGVGKDRAYELTYYGVHRPEASPFNIVLAALQQTMLSEMLSRVRKDDGEEILRKITQKLPVEMRNVVSTLLFDEGTLPYLREIAIEGEGEVALRYANSNKNPGIIGLKIMGSAVEAGKDRTYIVESFGVPHSEEELSGPVNYPELEQAAVKTLDYLKVAPYGFESYITASGRTSTAGISTDALGSIRSALVEMSGWKVSKDTARLSVEVAQKEFKDQEERAAFYASGVRDDEYRAALDGVLEPSLTKLFNELEKATPTGRSISSALLTSGDMVRAETSAGEKIYFLVGATIGADNKTHGIQVTPKGFEYIMAFDLANYKNAELVSLPDGSSEALTEAASELKDLAGSKTDIESKIVKNAKTEAESKIVANAERLNKILNKIVEESTTVLKMKLSDFEWLQRELSKPWVNDTDLNSIREAQGEKGVAEIIQAGHEARMPFEIIAAIRESVDAKNTATLDTLLKTIVEWATKGELSLEKAIEALTSSEKKLGNAADAEKLRSKLVSAKEALSEVLGRQNKEAGAGRKSTAGAKDETVAREERPLVASAGLVEKRINAASARITSRESTSDVYKRAKILLSSNIVRIADSDLLEGQILRAAGYEKIEGVENVFAASDVRNIAGFTLAEELSKLDQELTPAVCELLLDERVKGSIDQLVITSSEKQDFVSVRLPEEGASPAVEIRIIGTKTGSGQYTGWTIEAQTVFGQGALDHKVNINNVISLVPELHAAINKAIEARSATAVKTDSAAPEGSGSRKSTAGIKTDTPAEAYDIGYIKEKLSLGNFDANTRGWDLILFKALPSEKYAPLIPELVKSVDAARGGEFKNLASSRGAGIRAIGSLGIYAVAAIPLLEDIVEEETQHNLGLKDDAERAIKDIRMASEAVMGGATDIDYIESIRKNLTSDDMEKITRGWDEILFKRLSPEKYAILIPELVRSVDAARSGEWKNYLSSRGTGIRAIGSLGIYAVAAIPLLESIVEEETQHSLGLKDDAERAIEEIRLSYTEDRLATLILANDVRFLLTTLSYVELVSLLDKALDDADTTELDTIASIIGGFRDGAMEFLTSDALMTGLSSDKLETFLESLGKNSVPELAKYAKDAMSAKTAEAAAAGRERLSTAGTSVITMDKDTVFALAGSPIENTVEYINANMENVGKTVTEGLFHNGVTCHEFVIGAVPVDENGQELPQEALRGPVTGERSAAESWVTKESVANITITHAMVSLNNVEQMKNAVLKIYDAALEDMIPTQRIHCAISKSVLDKMENILVKDTDLMNVLGGPKSIRDFLAKTTMLDVINDKMEGSNTILAMPYGRATLHGMARINLAHVLEKSQDDVEAYENAVRMLAATIGLLTNNLGKVTDIERELLAKAASDPKGFFITKTFEIALPSCSKVDTEEIKAGYEREAAVLRSL